MLRTREEGTTFHQVCKLLQRDGSSLWCDVRGRYECDADGHPCRMFGVVMDISEHKLVQERQQLMLQELHHRVKNVLATVQAIAGLSGRVATDIRSFCAAFNQRVVSLSKTHTMLLAHNRQCLSIHDLIISEVGSYDDGSGRRVELIGPPLELPSQAASPLGLVLHELTTNAVKYGSLSVEGGRVEIGWKVSNDRGDKSTLSLHRKERDGPPVWPPNREGFGSTLLRSYSVSMGRSKLALTRLAWMST